MVSGSSCGFTCESQCPPHHIGIQPPPVLITMPGPIMTCANDLCAVATDSPCCGYRGYGGYGGGWGGFGGYGYGSYGGRGCGFGPRCAGGYGVCGW